MPTKAQAYRECIALRRPATAIDYLKALRFVDQRTVIQSLPLGAWRIIFSDGSTVDEYWMKLNNNDTRTSTQRSR